MWDPHTGNSPQCERLSLRISRLWPQIERKQRDTIQKATRNGCYRSRNLYSRAPRRISDQRQQRCCPARFSARFVARGSPRCFCLCSRGNFRRPAKRQSGPTSAVLPSAPGPTSRKAICPRSCRLLASTGDEATKETVKNYLYWVLESGFRLGI